MSTYDAASNSWGGFGGAQAAAQANARRGASAPPRKPPRRKPLGAEAWAQREAEKYIAAKVKAIEESQRLYLEELNKASQERIRQGQALAAWMAGQNFPGRVQGLYQTAGSDIAGYAGGFSEAMQGIANADAAQNTRMVSGTGQEGAVRNEGQAMGDVLYGAYGWSPAKAFAETGAAFASDAALQPSFAAQFAAAEAAQMQSDGLSALKDFALQMAEARSGKADIVNELRDTRLKAKDDAFDRKMAMLKWQADQHYRNYMLALERGDQKLAMKEYNLAVRKQKQAEIEANREYGLDTRRENRLQREANKPAASKATATQKRDSMKDVVSSEEDINKAVAAAIQKGEWKPSAGRSKERKALVDRIFREYAYLALTPAARARLKQIIMKAVKAAGSIGPTAPSGSGSSSPGGYEDYK